MTPMVPDCVIVMGNSSATNAHPSVAFSAQSGVPGIGPWATLVWDSPS